MSEGTRQDGRGNDMGFLGDLVSIFKPTREVIEAANLPRVKKLELQGKLADLEANVQEKVIELESKRLELQAKLYASDSKSDLIIVRLWRPVTSMALVGMVLLAGFGVIKLHPEIYYLCNIFLGAYAGGRSLEKALSLVKK